MVSFYKPSVISAIAVILFCGLFSGTAHAAEQPSPELSKMLQELNKSDLASYKAKQAEIEKYLNTPGNNTGANQAAYFNQLATADVSTQSMRTNYATGIIENPKLEAAVSASSLKPVSEEARQAQLKLLDHVLKTPGESPRLSAAEMMYQMADHHVAADRAAFIERIKALELDIRMHKPTRGYGNLLKRQLRLINIKAYPGLVDSAGKSVASWRSGAAALAIAVPAAITALTQAPAGAEAATLTNQNIKSLRPTAAGTSVSADPMDSAALK